jgi:hypothetical protein
VDPNPPIVEEFWGFWRREQGIDAEESPFEGVRVP